MSAVERFTLGAPNEEIFGFCQGISVDDLVFVSGQVGKDNKTGEMVGPHDLAGRYARTIANIREIAGSLLPGLARLVDLQVHIAEPLARSWEQIIASQGDLLRDDECPAVSVVSVEGLARPDYLVEISAHATAADPDAVAVPTAIERALGGSRGVRLGDLVFLGGHLPVDDDGRVQGGSVPEQLDLVARRMDATLRELGASLADCVSVQLWIAEHPTPDGFDALSAVNSSHFGKSKPTSTLVFVPELPLGALVQLSAVAVSPKSG
ncbi:MAG: RidA family protein [Actinomycetota bacterium]